MAQTINLSAKGIHTYASPLSGVPKGALSVADDVNISRLNIIEPRRGFSFLSQSLPDAADRTKRFFFYADKLLVHYGDTLGLYDSGSGILSRGTLVTPPNAQSVRSRPMNESLYLTSSTGIKKMDDTAANLYAAGIPKGLMVEQSGSLVTSGTAITEDYGTVAYRYIIGRKDKKNGTTYGGVSSRLVVFNNSTNDVDVPLKVWLPAGLDTTYFVQVYRTAAFPGSSGVPGVPNDEMQICYEKPLTSTDVSNGYFTFTDIQPDDLLGATLYTSPSQGLGIAENNEEPPVARDIEVYKNYLFFADVMSKHRYAFTLIACGGSGLAVNDTITISNGTTTEVYTAKASSDAANKEFAVDTASASLATRIDNTVRSLAGVINQGSALVYASLLSTGGSDLPGKLLLEERSLGGNAFTVVSTRAVAFSPQLATTATATQTSANSEFKNGLMFSKQGNPEAVPAKNIFFVGSAADRIKRIVALQDALFIFKETDGVFILVGENEASFSVRPLDLSAKIVSPDSLVSLNNFVFGLFDGGVAACSEGGLEFISEPIKDKLQYLYANALDEVRTHAFGVGYNVDGKYILALPSTDGDTSATQQYVYDVFGQTWCRWTLNIMAGGINPADEVLYTSPADSNKIRYERKQYDPTDNADFLAYRTIASYAGTTLTLDDVSDIEVGDILEQGSALGYVESVDLAANTVVIDAVQTWTTGTADVSHLKAIHCRVEWNAEYADNPAGQKLFYETNLLFKQAFQKQATVHFFSDVNPSESVIDITAPGGNGSWGDFEFGEAVFGGDSLALPFRLGVPRGHRRCNLLTVRFESKVAYSDFQLNGVSMTFTPISTRTTRGKAAGED